MHSLGAELQSFRPSARVHELGLRGYDALGRTALVAWSQVHEVVPISMLGLEYVRIRTTGTSREVWLPRFLVDQQAFDRLVHDLAGRGHPLSRGLTGSPG